MTWNPLGWIPDRWFRKSQVSETPDTDPRDASYHIDTRANDGELTWRLIQLDEDAGWGGVLELEHAETGRTYTLYPESGDVVEDGENNE